MPMLLLIQKTEGTRKQKIDINSYMYRLFLSLHSFSVTLLILGFRLFFFSPKKPQDYPCLENLIL